MSAETNRSLEKKPVEPTHHVPATRATNPAQLREERWEKPAPEVATPDGSPKATLSRKKKQRV